MNYSRPVYKPIDVVRFYSKFNRFLFKAMQGQESAIEKIFSTIFVEQEKPKNSMSFSRTSRLPLFMRKKQWAVQA